MKRKNPLPHKTDNVLRRNNLLCLCGVLLSAGLLGQTGPTEAANLAINFTGTLQEPSCSVVSDTGTDTLTVAFSDVKLEEIGTAAAQQDMKIKLACDGPSLGKSVQVKIENGAGGTDMDVGGVKVLSTSMAGMGVKISDHNNGTVEPGTWHTLTGVDMNANGGTGAQTSSVLTFKAQLVSDNAGQLTGGSFSASATMSMQYS